MHIEGDVVVYQKDGTRSMISGITDVLEHTVKGIGIKVSAPHFYDRAETAVIRAAARSLNYIHLAAQQGIALKDASGAIGEADIAIFQSMHRPSGVMEPTAGFTTGKAADFLKAAAAFQGTQKLAKGNFAFTAHDVVCP